MLLASVATSVGLAVGGAGLLMLLVGLGLVVAGRTVRRRRAAFAASGTRVPGTVVDLEWLSTGGRGPRSGPTPMAFPVLRYSLADGTELEQRSFEGASPPAARAGSVVDVVYDPADPHRVRVAEDRAALRLLPGVLVAVGGLSAAGGAATAAAGVALLLA